MISFKTYITEKINGNYVSIDVQTGITIPSLEKIYGGANVCEPSDQHVTLIYSKGTDVSKSKILDTLHHWDGEIEAKVDEIAAFDAIPKNGERDTNLCTIVIKLKSEILKDIHNRLKSIGLKHSYPEFSPHISILYNFPREDKEKAMEIIREYMKENYSTVILKKYNVQPIIENWADKK